MVSQAKYVYSYLADKDFMLHATVLYIGYG